MIIKNTEYKTESISLNSGSRTGSFGTKKPPFDLICLSLQNERILLMELKARYCKLCHVFLTLASAVSKAGPYRAGVESQDLY